jgi:hypothetical protein
VKSEEPRNIKRTLNPSGTGEHEVASIGLLKYRRRTSWNGKKERAGQNGAKTK